MIINSKQKIIKVTLSKHGLPTLTESGGGRAKTGFASIVASSKGGRKKPIHIPSKGQITNGDHAFFVIKENDVRIEVSHYNGDFNIKVYQVAHINLEAKEIIFNLIEEYSSNNFSDYQLSLYKEAIKHGIDKATTPNCKNPFFYYQDKKVVEIKLSKIA